MIKTYFTQELRIKRSHYRAGLNSKYKKKWNFSERDVQVGGNMDKPMVDSC